MLIVGVLSRQELQVDPLGLGLSGVEGVHLADGKATLGKSLGLRALEPDDKATKMCS